MIETRRTFLKQILALTAGASFAITIPPAYEVINTVVKQTTGKTTSNASIEVAIEETCKEQADKFSCANEYLRSPMFKIQATVFPVAEEAIFRLLPSVMIDAVDGLDDNINALKHVSSGFGLRRREWLTGIISSLAFSFMHNITPKGLDTNHIPVPHALGGMGFWYLQRKLGFISNTFSHVLYNYLAIKDI